MDIDEETSIHIDDALIDALLAMANAHTVLMNGMSDEEAGAHLKQVFDEHDVVIAIWPDASHPTGMGLKPIFGDMKDLRGQVTLSAIGCPTEEDADQIVALFELHDEHGGRVN